MMQPLAIEVENLWFSYHEHLILRDIRLSIKEGDFVAVLGPNGGGKTTLLKLLLGILKPDRGTIRLYGKPPDKMRNRVGYVPQHISFNKDFPISVLDVTLMGRLGHTGPLWRYSGEDRIKAQQALEKMGMWEYRDRNIGKLSGGQRQRVFIARALVSDPQILFMDEPTANIDMEGQTKLYEILKELNKTMTILVVSHDLSFLSSYVKSVACVNQTLYFHDSAEITSEMLDMAPHCPIELVAHGPFPHRVLLNHKDHEHD